MCLLMIVGLNSYLEVSFTCFLLIYLEKLQGYFVYILVSYLLTFKFQVCCLLISINSIMVLLSLRIDFMIFLHTFFLCKLNHFIWLCNKHYNKMLKGVFVAHEGIETYNTTNADNCGGRFTRATFKVESVLSLNVQLMLKR